MLGGLADGKVGEGQEEKPPGRGAKKAGKGPGIEVESLAQPPPGLPRARLDTALQVSKALPARPTALQANRPSGTPPVTERLAREAPRATCGHAPA